MLFVEKLVMGFRVFQTLFTLFLASGLAHGADKPPEPYTLRPDILEVQAQAHLARHPYWSGYKNGKLETIAQLIELYPDHELVFLARDGEYLHDLARLALVNEPQNLSRIRLMNVSTENKASLWLGGYLKQQGLSRKTLWDGQKVLFVDSGFAGSIPKAIRSRFPFQGSRLQTHLLQSTNPRHPSSRVFSIAATGQEFGGVDKYENIPHYTERSYQYKKINGKWTPISRPQPEGYKKATEELMEDLKAFWELPATQAHFQKRRLQWRKLHELWKPLQENPLTFEQAVAQFEKVDQELLSLISSAANPEEEKILRGAVTDFLETVQRNLPPKSTLTRNLMNEILVPSSYNGFAFKGSHRENRALNWFRTTERYPEAAQRLLKDLDDGLKWILKQPVSESVAMLETLTQGVSPQVITDLLSELSIPPTGKEVLARLIRGKDPRWAYSFAESAKLAKAFRRDPEILDLIRSREVFAKPLKGTHVCPTFTEFLQSTLVITGK